MYTACNDFFLRPMYAECMTNTILSLSSLAILTLSSLALAARKKVAQSLPLLGLFLAVFYLDNLVIVLVNVFPQLQIIPNTTWGTLNCAWSGKLYCIPAALLIAGLMARLIARGEL